MKGRDGLNTTGADNLVKVYKILGFLGLLDSGPKLAPGGNRTRDL